MYIKILAEEKQRPLLGTVTVQYVTADGRIEDGTLVSGKYIVSESDVQPIKIIDVISEGAERQGRLSDALNSIHGPKQLAKWVVAFTKRDDVNEKGLRSILPALKALLRFDPMDPVISRPERLISYALNFLNENEPRNTEPLADAAYILKSCEPTPDKKRRALQKCFNHVKRQCVDLCFAMYRDVPPVSEGLIRYADETCKDGGCPSAELEYATVGKDGRDEHSYRWMPDEKAFPGWEQLSVARTFEIIGDGHPMALDSRATLVDPRLGDIARRYNEILEIEQEIASAAVPTPDMTKRLEGARLALVQARQAVVPLQSLRMRYVKNIPE